MEVLEKFCFKYGIGKSIPGIFFVRFSKTQGEINSSSEKTQGIFGAKTQATGAFTANSFKKLKVPELLRLISPENSR